jgi:excinuclease UvrABC nuclease subunit
MENQTFKPIAINWSYEEILINLPYEEKLINKNKLKEISKENCLYQAYGDSPIYGRDVLLYIGRTKDLHGRITGHLKTDFSRINKLSLCFGYIDKVCAILPDHPMEKLIVIAESLLITMLKPSHNSSNIKNTNLFLKNHNKYLILNKENRKALPLEVTNIWWEQTSNIFE